MHPNRVFLVVYNHIPQDVDLTCFLQNVLLKLNTAFILCNILHSTKYLQERIQEIFYMRSSMVCVSFSFCQWCIEKAWFITHKIVSPLSQPQLPMTSWICLVSFLGSDINAICSCLFTCGIFCYSIYLGINQM